MRRITNAELIRENLFLVVISIMFFAAGIFIMVLLFIPSDPLEYNELLEKEITVESLKLVIGGKGAESRYHIKTDAGEKYVIVGEYEYDHDTVEEKLSPGTKAKIKYIEGGIAFFRQNNVEEVYANGECLVSFSPAEEPSVPAALFVSALCFAGAAGSLKFLSWNIKHIRQLEEKRDRRIAKKYGKAQR